LWNVWGSIVNDWETVNKKKSSHVKVSNVTRIFRLSLRLYCPCVLIFRLQLLTYVL